MNVVWIIIRIGVIRINIIWVILIQFSCNLNQHDSKLQNFCAQMFNFKILSCSEFLKTLLFPSFSTSLFTAPFHNTLQLEKSDAPMLERTKIPMFLGGIPSPILFLNPIPVPLSRLVICGIMLPMILDGFTRMPSFVLHPKSILIFYNYYKSQTICTNHHVPIYQWKRLLG